MKKITYFVLEQDYDFLGMFEYDSFKEAFENADPETCTGIYEVTRHWEVYNAETDLRKKAVKKRAYIGTA